LAARQAYCRREDLQGEDRAIYGAEIVKNLSFELTQIYGKGFDSSNLYKFMDFYKAFPNIFHTLRGKSENTILDTPCLNSERENLKCVIQIFHVPLQKKQR
jgi:hypothetical protein